MKNRTGDALQEFDVVALLHRLPEHGVEAGQVGTVLYVHGGGEAYEVEFFENPRRPIVLTLQREALLKLRGIQAGAA